MRRKLQWPSFLVMTIFLFNACGKSLPELKSIDLHAWKDDKNGCQGIRTASISALQDQREQLLGLKEMQIITLLGKPDQNELYKRNQKFYHYFLTPAPDCAEQAAEEKKLSIRFNAMGLAKEIHIE